MNRKNFISTIATASATSLVGANTLFGNSVASPGPSAGQQLFPEHKIKRGVSLYSYQEALCIKGFTLWDQLEEIADMGAYGFEFMLRDMPRESGYPNVKPAWIDKWWAMNDKFGTIPVTYCAFPDSYRQLKINTDDENVEYQTWNFKIARELGFTKVRLLEDRENVIRRLIPIAEKLGLWMGRELHYPVMYKTDKGVAIQLEMAKQHPNVFGFVPDMQIFQKYPRPLDRELQIRAGTLTRETALYIEDSLRKGVNKAEVAKKVAGMKPKPGDTAYVDTAYSYSRTFNDPKDLIPLIPYIKHIHGKCHELTKGNEFKDTEIAYDEVVPVLIANGYEGYIVTEFEGQRSDVGTDEVDEFDEVRRWQVMMKSLLGV